MKFIDKIIFDEPTPVQYITEVYCWIATFRDGTEGILAHGFDGMGLLPLLSSNKATAEKLEKTANHALSLSKNAMSVRMVTFKSMEQRPLHADG